ncbi:MAG: hypothetical protein ABW128_07725 [Rhizorhabdus sp.]
MGVQSPMQPQSPSPAQGDRRRYGAETVAVPRQDQGVGQALRDAYLARTADMPREMALLLDKLY